MTTFNKELFTYSGGFLVYRGAYDGRPVYEDKPGVHPSRVGMGKELFIARFKYNRKDKAGFLSFLIKNFTVEEFAERAKSLETPLGILKSKGYFSKTQKDACKAYGLPATEEGYHKALELMSAKFTKAA